MVNASQRDLGFDLIRSLSTIWIVCVWHLLAYANPEVNYVTAPVKFCAELALSCFMFISGYFLGKKKIKERKDVLDFYKKRFWRFYILYVIAAFILLAGGLFAGKMWFQTPMSFISTIMGFSSFVDPSVGTIWFMSMLMMFYILTPLILYGDRSVPKRIEVSIIIYLCFVALYYILPSVDFRLLRFFPLYTLGLLMNDNEINRVKKSPVIAFSAIVVCFLLIVFPVSLEVGSLSVAVSSLLYVLKFFSAIIFLIWCVDKIKLTGGGKFCLSIEFISYISLALYLFHRPVYQGLAMVVNKMNISGIISFNSEWWVLYLVYVPTVIVVSYIIQKAYDKLLIKIR